MDKIFIQEMQDNYILYLKYIIDKSVILGSTNKHHLLRTLEIVHFTYVTDSLIEKNIEFLSYFEFFKKEKRKINLNKLLNV